MTTLRTFPLSLQECFNAAYIGVVNQGCKSIDNSRCVYDDGNGNRCAAGHFFALTDPEVNVDECIRDNLDYDKDTAVDDAMNALGYKHPDFLPALLTLQSHHDDSDKDDFINSFKSQMVLFANANGLTVPVI